LSRIQFLNIMKISNYPENELLEIASGFKKHLSGHLSSSKNAQLELDQAVIYKFKALFYEVQAYTLESETDSVTYKYKLDLDAMSDQVRNFFLIFRFYLQKAFPYDSNIWEAYGYCEMEKVIHNYSELRSFLEGSVNLINEKKADLKAANCPDSTLEEIVELSKQISDEHEELLKYLERKEVRNKAYKNRLEELFKLMKVIHEAAIKGFKDEPEMLKHLTFPTSEPVLGE
jgi:hypothetical protein